MTHPAAAADQQPGALTTTASPLLRNAVASIRLGVEDFESGGQDRHLSAARNMHAGVLLLFKERLRALSPPGSKEVLVN